MDSEKLINHMFQDQCEALKTGEIERFMKWFRLTAVSDYYLRRWFNGYAVKKAQPVGCRFKIENLKLPAGALIQCEIIFDLDYSGYDPETAIFNVDIQKEDIPTALFITSCTVNMKPGRWFDEPVSAIPIVIAPQPDDREAINPKWWEKNELSEIAYSSTDHLKESLYARAVPKSVRYRGSHPEIDSAAYLSDLMTLRLCKLAFALKSDDIIAMAKGLHLYGQKALTPKTYNHAEQGNQSDLPVRELSLRPLLNVDEIFAGKKAHKPAAASCVEIASFYASMLRLGGIEPLKVFIVIQPFHYLTLFKLTHGFYIMSFNEVLPMGPGRLYGDTDVTRIVSPVYFLDDKGQTNMPGDVLSSIRCFLQEGVPVFSGPTPAEKTGTIPIEAEPNQRVRDFNTPHELHNALRKHIFEMSRRYPASPFTWGKYSYQTLLVNQPQAYVTWSMKASETREFAKHIDSLEALFTWIQNNLKKGSIFQEPDRVMTADQVLRHRRGTPKDRALFAFVIAKLINAIRSGGIVLTIEASYVISHDGVHNKCIYDAQTWRTVSRINGGLILAFDDVHVYNPLKLQHENPPPWLHLIM
jgi:hypothetical protein